MARFFSRLSYSFGNEDWKTEEKALQLKPQDRVLCITASGDRPLNVLTHDVGEVVAIDANPIQNHLLELKKQAIEQLDYPGYLEFLGLRPRNDRLQVLERLCQGMEESQAAFWKGQQKMIEAGVIYQGAMEKLLQNFSAPVLRFFRGKKIDALFRFTDLESQRAFVHKEWDTYLWKKAFDIALNPYLAKWTLKDPGLYNHIGRSIKAGDYIRSRMNHSLMNCLARENALISMMLKGTADEEAYPPYLTEAGTKLIRPRLKRLTPVTSDVLSYLEKADTQSFDCFSLSDVASYLSQKDFLRMLEGIRRTAKPNARVSIRQFLSSHAIPDEVGTWLKRDADLEKQLEIEDRCFVYRYITGCVN